MSTINTNGIDGNYPTPGQNNSSQGFRDNFTSIKNNLNTAGTEITELQDKAVLKQGLNNITLDNNMANTLISNAAVRTFRHTMYNLGNNVAGTVVVDCTLGDVQTATITGDTTFQLAGWAPTNTKHTITLDLTIANTTANIIFPGNVSQGGSILENNDFTISSGNLAIATAPYGVTSLQYDLSTEDCGNSILISPINRSYQSSQIEERVVMTPTGYEGDRNGDIAVEPSVQPVTVTASEAAGDTLTTSSTAGFYLGMPIQFYGVVFGNIVVGTTYYVRTIVANTSFTISATLGGGNFALADATGTMQSKPVSYLYLSVGTYNSTTTNGTVLSTTVTSNQIEFNAVVPNIATHGLNQPIVFTGDASEFTAGGLEVNTTYYIGTIDISGANTRVSVSRTRTNGVADANVTLATSSTFTSALGTVYNQGNDIWKRVTLDSF